MQDEKANPKVRKASELKKTAQVSVGVTADEKRRIIAAAEIRRRKFSEFVRESVMQVVAEVEREQATG